MLKAKSEYRKYTCELFCSKSSIGPKAIGAKAAKTNIVVILSLNVCSVISVTNNIKAGNTNTKKSIKICPRLENESLKITI